MRYTAYYFEFKDGNNNDMRVDFKLEATSPIFPLELQQGSGDAVSIKYGDVSQQKYPSLIGSTATIRIQQAVYNQYQSFFTYDKREWLIEIRENGSIVWTGWLSTEQYTQDSDTFVLELEAHDGIADLANTFYAKTKNEDLISRFDKLIEIVSDTDLDLELHIGRAYKAGTASEVDGTLTPFKHMYEKVRALSGRDYLSVLKDILSGHLMLQLDGAWKIYSYDQIVKSNSCTFEVFDSVGTYDRKYTETNVCANIERGTDTYFWGHFTETYDPTTKNLIASHETEQRESVLLNYEMDGVEEGDTDNWWYDQGTSIYHDRVINDDILDGKRMIGFRNNAVDSVVSGYSLRWHTRLDGSFGSGNPYIKLSYNYVLYYAGTGTTDRTDVFAYMCCWWEDGIGGKYKAKLEPFVDGIAGNTPDNIVVLSRGSLVSVPADYRVNISTRHEGGLVVDERVPIEGIDEVKENTIYIEAEDGYTLCWGIDVNEGKANSSDHDIVLLMGNPVATPMSWTRDTEWEDDDESINTIRSVAKENTEISTIFNVKDSNVATNYGIQATSDPEERENVRNYYTIDGSGDYETGTAVASLFLLFTKIAGVVTYDFVETIDCRIKTERLTPFYESDGNRYVFRGMTHSYRDVSVSGTMAQLSPYKEEDIGLRTTGLETRKFSDDNNDERIYKGENQDAFNILVAQDKKQPYYVEDEKTEYPTNIWVSDDDKLLLSFKTDEIGGYGHVEIVNLLNGDTRTGFVNRSNGVVENTFAPISYQASACDRSSGNKSIVHQYDIITIRQLEMTTDWDVSSVTPYSVTAATLGVTWIRQAFVTRDGNYLYVVDSDDEITYTLTRHPLSTAGNIETAGTADKTTSFDFEFTADISFDGRYLLITNKSTGYIDRYTMDTVWDIEDMTKDMSFWYDRFATTIDSCFSNDGETMYVLAQNTDGIYVIDAFDIYRGASVRYGCYFQASDYAICEFDNGGDNVNANWSELNFTAKVTGGALSGVEFGDTDVALLLRSSSGGVSPFYVKAILALDEFEIENGDYVGITTNFRMLFKKDSGTFYIKLYMNGETIISESFTDGTTANYAFANIFSQLTLYCSNITANNGVTHTLHAVSVGDHYYDEVGGENIWKNAVENNTFSFTQI